LQGSSGGGSEGFVSSRGQLGGEQELDLVVDVVTDAEWGKYVLIGGGEGGGLQEKVREWGLWLLDCSAVGRIFLLSSKVT